MQDLPPPFSTSAQHVAGSTVEGCGGFFLTDMFNDNDLFAYAANQQELTVKKRRAAKPLPIMLIRKSLEIDKAIPSGLRWLIRPLHHFADKRVWKISKTRDAGKPAGVRRKGTVYFQVVIDGAPYMNHRIIFFLTHGVDPGDKFIDHIQPDLPLPNVASNLRLATNAENMRNQKKHRDNKSGATGVCWDAYYGKWKAFVTIRSRRQIHLGHFEDFNDAVAARKAAEVMYYGEFSRNASQSRNPITEQP